VAAQKENKKENTETKIGIIIIASKILPGVQYMISRPHFGQEIALFETGSVQSGQGINDI
jgi:hypothetical protein